MLASEIVGRTASGTDGRPIGVVAEVLCVPGEDGVPRIRAAVVRAHRPRRLLGYDRPGVQGPWLIEQLAGWLHRGAREVPWTELRLTPGRASDRGQG